MNNQFLQALSEVAKFVGAAIDRLRKDSNEQFDKLRGEVRESKQNIQLDITPRAIEELQSNSNININKVTQALLDASKTQTKNLATVTHAVERMTEAIRTDTSEAHLLRQSNQKLNDLEKAITGLTKVVSKDDDKASLKALNNLSSEIKKIKLDVKPTDMTPVVNSLKSVSLELKDLKTEITKSNPTTAIAALAEAFSKFNIEIPKTIKLDEQQVRKLSQKAVSTIPTKNATSYTIDTVALTDADTEYSFKFPANTVSWTFKLRSAGANLYYSHATGKLPVSGDNSDYMTLLPGLSSRSQDNVEWGATTIYFESDTATQVVEIEIFTL